MGFITHRHTDRQTDTHTHTHTKTHLHTHLYLSFEHGVHNTHTHTYTHTHTHAHTKTHLHTHLCLSFDNRVHKKGLYYWRWVLSIFLGFSPRKSHIFTGSGFFDIYFWRIHLLKEQMVCITGAGPCLQPIAFEVSFYLNLESQSPWSLFNGTW